MQKFFVDSNQIDEEKNLIIIEGDNVNHIKNVLRCEKGERIEICEKCNNPSKFVCEIIDLNGKQIKCSIIERINESKESGIKIHIFQGLPKAEKMELIIQKCTELGAYEFIPTQMSRCVVKLNGKDATKKVERWQKIAEVAAKQCGRDIIPKVSNISSIKEIICNVQNFDLIIVAYENERETYLKEVIKDIENENLNIGIIIGPEGGFDEKEVEALKNAGAKIVTLGSRILRTETVAMILTGIIMYEVGDIGGK